MGASSLRLERCTVPYVAMRVMLATFGVGMVPLTWYMAVELILSQRSCHLAAFMILLGDYYMLLASLLSNSCAV